MTEARDRPRGGVIALIMLGLIVAALCGGPLVWRVDPTAVVISEKFAPPSWAAPLGRDEFGRDLLSRVLHGGRISLLGGVIVLMGNTVLGLGFGALAAGDSWFAQLIRRLIDGLLALPTLIVALALVGVLGKSFGNLLLALVVTGWPWYARVYRGYLHQQRRHLYVLAAQALGVPPSRIMWRHIGPNLASTILVLTAASWGNALLSLTALSFLGLGVQPPQAEWGAMMSSARLHFQSEPWLIMVPGITLGLTVLMINLIGDALRDWADPHMRHHRPHARVLPRSVPKQWDKVQEQQHSNNPLK